ncbi:MAG TPA: hypothetical protein VF723_04165 [Pyrinomonadaceae bacterium]|jgi:hypothetical protein
MASATDHILILRLARRLWPWAIFAAILAFYLLLPTKNYFWDGVDFAQTIEDAPALDSSLIHPNHLFYNPFGYLIYKALRATGAGFRALAALQMANAVLGVLTAYLLFRILRRVLRSEYFGYVLTLLFALSATWWKFSTDADSYIPSVLFLLIAFSFLLPGKEPRPVLAALAHSVAMMFHQMAIFFFPVVLAGIFLQTRGPVARRRILPLLQYGASGFLITVATFYYSFYRQTGRSDLHTFLKWVASFSPEPGHTFSVWGNFVYTAQGHVKLFASGRLLYLKDSLDALTLLLLAALLGLVLVFLFKLARNRARVKSFLAAMMTPDERFTGLRLLCFIWIASFLVFQYFFIPQHTYYRLFYLPALILLLGTYLVQADAGQPRPRTYIAAFLVAAIAVSNLVFYIRPLSQVENYPPLAMALSLNRAWPEGTIVYFASRNSDNSLVRYFNPAARWQEVNQETMQAELPVLQQAGGNAWLETSLIELYQATPDGRQWLETHTLKDPQYELVNDKYRLRFYRLNPASFAPPAASTGGR